MLFFTLSVSTDSGPVLNLSSSCLASSSWSIGSGRGALDDLCRSVWVYKVVLHGSVDDDAAQSTKRCTRETSGNVLVDR